MDWALRNKRVITILAVVGLLILAGGAAQRFGQTSFAAEGPSTALVYLTNDDGKTTFVGPLSHTSSVTVEAVMYSCDDNATRFIGYLKRTKPNAKTGPVAKQIDPALQAFVPASNVGGEFEIKRPGDAKWVPMRSAAASAMFHVQSPDGKGMPVQVAP